MSPEHDLRCISKFMFTSGLLFKVTFYSKRNLPMVLLPTIAQTTVSSVLPTVVFKKG